MFLDIGDVVVKCATDEEVVQSLRSLPPSEKYAYLHRHVKPENSFTFPTTFTGGCNRSFLASWLKEHGSVTASSLMVHSEHNVECTCIGPLEREKNPPLVDHRTGLTIQFHFMLGNVTTESNYLSTTFIEVRMPANRRL